MAVKTQQPASTHFIYKYEDTMNGAQQRAIVLQATCESDLATLEGMFDASGGFDAGNTITAEVNSLAGGLGQNFGYQTGGATRITVTPWASVPPAATADSGATPRVRRRDGGGSDAAARSDDADPPSARAVSVIALNAEGPSVGRLSKDRPCPSPYRARKSPAPPNWR
jgi:hypothetical protein